MNAAQKSFAVAVYGLWTVLTGACALTSFYAMATVSGVFGHDPAHYMLMGFVFSAVCFAAVVATIHCIRFTK